MSPKTIRWRYAHPDDYMRQVVNAEAQIKGNWNGTVDWLRLKWNVPESAKANWLAPERSKLVEKAGHA